MLLAIETATAACSVALIDGGMIVAEQHEIVGRGHAERLIPMIAALPDRGRASLVAVDCGPGSFTGVRVGLAAARAFGLAWGAEVRGFSSLALIAAALERTDEQVTVALTGGHGELFVQQFALAPFSPMTELISLRPEIAAERFTTDRVAGSGAEALVAARGYGTVVEAFPRAADLIRLPDALATLAPKPIYGRAPDAKLPA
jgi:tRNA threonylcarbamoyladenosine biosynthesis protein TsaB